MRWSCRFSLLQRLLITLLVHVCLLVTWFYFMWKPLCTYINEQQGEINALTQSIVVVRHQLNQAKQWASEYEQNKRVLLTKQQTYVRQKMNIDKIIEMAEKQKLTLESVQKLQAQENEWYLSVPYLIVVTGGYQEMTLFIEAVTKVQNSYSINSLSLERADKQGLRLTISLALNVVKDSFFSLLHDDTEHDGTPLDS